MRLTETSSALHISFNYILCSFVALKSWFVLIHKCKVQKMCKAKFFSSIQWLCILQVFRTLACFFGHTTFWFALNRMNFVLHFLFLSLSKHHVINWRTPLFTVHSKFHSIYHCMHIHCTSSIPLKWTFLT